MPKENNYASRKESIQGMRDVLKFKKKQARKNRLKMRSIAEMSAATRRVEAQLSYKKIHSYSKK